MIRRSAVRVWAAACVAIFGTSAAAGEDDPAAAIARYRALLQDDNPAELWEGRGEAQWKLRRGPSNASLEACDLGRGAGVLAGAYAQLPRLFADADRVMDLETRLVYCMVTLQGFSFDEASRQPYGSGDRASDFEALSAYIVAQSRGMPVHVALEQPKERLAYQLGERLFYFRAGPYDFACATCHSQPGKRIRLQLLPDLTESGDARRAYTTWPAYRVSQGELRTLQWRMNDCLRQQRFPELKFVSDASVALITFLAKNAEGGVMAAPGLKR